jgi:hypothetical protein
MPWIAYLLFFPESPGVAIVDDSIALDVPGLVF